VNVNVLSARPLIAAALVDQLNQTSEFQARQLSHVGQFDGKGIMVVDVVRLPNAIEQITAFSQANAAPVIALVAVPSDLLAEQLRRAGAKAGFVETDSVETLRYLIRHVSCGSFITSDSFRAGEQFLNLLTRRQRQVLELVLRGQSDADIGGALGIATITVETHRRDVQRKLRCRGHHELIIHATHYGYVDPVDITLDRLNRQASRQRLNTS
jgi:DNA-binding NarL/FixJ family response regulator